MKNTKLFLGALIAGLCIGFFIRAVVYPPKTIVEKVEVRVPEIVKETDTIYVTKWEERVLPGEDRIVVDSTYYAKYMAEKDKTKQLQIFLDAIKIQDTTLTVEDNDVIKIDVWSKTRGDLLAQSAKYTIKERTLEVPVELPQEPRFRFYGGVFTGVPTSLQGRFSVGASLGLEIDRKSHWSLMYDNHGTVTLGVQRNLFNF